MLATPLRPEPLAQHNLCNSTDVDEVRETVGGRFCDHRLERSSARGGFDARFNHAQGEAMGLAYLRYGGDVEIEPGCLDNFYLLQVPIRGYSEVLNGKDHVQTSVGTASMLNPTRPTWMRMVGDCRKIMVQIDRSALHSMVERYLGLHLEHAVVFDSLVSFKAPALRQWNDHLTTCVHAADAGALFGNANPGTQMLVEEQLILDFVQAQSSNVRHFFDMPQPEMMPRQLRLARDYLHNMVAEPIVIADVADAAGVTARSLQLSFKRQFGISPLHYLRKLRLDLAHYELLNAAPGKPVSEIAYQVGFSHLGRFSIAYRKRFGEKPSETLSSGQ